jgi:formamidopyrimidine-DNA glycosylase
MPELPEVETVRRILRRALGGKRIAAAEVVPDEIVLSGRDPAELERHLLGATVCEVGRKGKYWWLELDRAPFVFGHLGMAGWIREIGQPSIRLLEHGNAPWEDESGRPRFLKLMLQAEDGARIAFTDGRRLARLWTANSPAEDRAVQALGPDTYEAMPAAAELHAMLAKRKAPIKALLLDQKLFAGIGNWLADEALYQARIAPARGANTLTRKEVARLRDVLWQILDHAVKVGADASQYPSGWLFNHRWGGAKGTDTIDGHAIVRDTIGGRTTAWCPSLQK